MAITPSMVDACAFTKRDCPVDPSVAPSKSWPASQLLEDFAMPPELREEADRYCGRYGFAGRYRAGVERDLKLQYYFGGQTVVAKATPAGLQILAAGLPDSEKFRAEVDRIRVRGGPSLEILTPYPLHDLDNEVLTPFSNG